MKTKKISTIQVKRKVEQTYVRMVEKSVAVEPHDLTVIEIEELSSEYHLPLVLFFRKQYHELKTLTQEQRKTIQSYLQNHQHTQSDIQPYDLSNVSIHTDRPVEYRSKTTSHPRASTEGIVGKKVGRSSIYHYVYWTLQRKKWMNNFTNETFDDEVACAKSADAWLKANDDKNRPLNREEFPELTKEIK